MRFCENALVPERLEQGGHAIGFQRIPENLCQPARKTVEGVGVKARMFDEQRPPDHLVRLDGFVPDERIDVGRLYLVDLAVHRDRFNPLRTQDSDHLGDLMGVCGEKPDLHGRTSTLQSARPVPTALGCCPFLWISTPICAERCRRRRSRRWREETMWCCRRRSLGPTAKDSSMRTSGASWKPMTRPDVLSGMRTTSLT